MKERTIASVLRARADSQRAGEAAIRFKEGDGWTEWSWSRFWEVARRAGVALLESGVRPGDHVLVVVPDVRPAVTALFGLWAMGGVPIQIGLPFRLTDRAAFLSQLVETACRVDAQFLLLSRALSGLAAPAGIKVLIAEDILIAEDQFSDHGWRGLPDVNDVRGTALIQLTSGTTSRPRGVVVPHDRLMLHLEHISQALPSHQESAAVSWLPLHHDMGLIGGLLFPIYNGFIGHMISTAEFQQRPWVWLESMSRFRATMSAAPPSAYAVCLGLAPRLSAAGLDLSAWECAMVGAEPISATLLRGFSSALAPCGFRPESFFPVYGLAEATVAVTFPELPGPAIIDRVEPGTLECEGRAVPAGANRNALEFVSVGRAVPGSNVRIVNQSGGVLAERMVGAILVSSDTLMTGYYGEPVATCETIQDGWLQTGDLGYQANGLLFITGRKKEIIIKGGHNLIPSVLEEIVASVDGVRAGDVAAVGVRSDTLETETVWIVAETRLAPDQHDALSLNIRAALKCRGVAVDRIVLAPPQSLPKTTSGKIQRGAIARMLEIGQPVLPGLSCD
jgi:acyl-CoA synthetase (AMP-forming)/AMP-acid ligase II